MRLSCGHEGNEIWRSEDGKIVGVQGTISNCSVCMRRDKNGTMNPTVYLIKIEETKKVES